MTIKPLLHNLKTYKKLHKNPSKYRMLSIILLIQYYFNVMTINVYNVFILLYPLVGAVYMQFRYTSV